MNLDLFGRDTPGTCERMGPCAFVLRGFALSDAATLLQAVDDIAARAPFRRMVTPNGHMTSAALTNCGTLGWTSDRCGYRYDAIDPVSGKPWPTMPTPFYRLARDAAQVAGMGVFRPDACLINLYLPDSHLSLHQDKNECDFSAPIVSVSLGMSAIFLFGGRQRGERALRVPLHHGDVALWGGEDRLRYHGILSLEGGSHPLLGARRINLTFRKAGHPRSAPSGAVSRHVP